MKATYIGHACWMLESGGTRLLMDPWLVDPTYHGTWWHYPPLEITPQELPKIDYLYISHEHPDHFDPPTLALLDKDIKIIIAKYKKRRFYDRIKAIGFRSITELEFGKETDLNGSGLTVRLIPPDRPWDDSAMLVKDRQSTVLNVNDCHLDNETLARMGREENIDLAFLTFTGASQYPGCFEFPLASKIDRWRDSKESHVEEFVNWAKLLRAKQVVPAAGNFAFLAPDQLFMNTGHYVNTPQDAVDRLAVEAPDIEGLQLNPGDVWESNGHVTRLKAPPDWSKRLDHVEALSAEWAERIGVQRAAEAAPPADLYDRFHSFFTAILQSDPAIAKRINIVSYWIVDGPCGGDWVIDFTRQSDWVYRGVPPQWNLRLKFPAELVYKGVTGQGVWDDLILSFRIRLARNPDRYNKEFWTWLCKL